jgi:hypothetical protein
MNRFLLGALAMGAFIVLTSFALRFPVEPALKDGPAWTVSDYRLDRAFRVQVPPSGATGQVQAGAGFIITQVHTLPGPFQGSFCSITVNGATETFVFNQQGSTAIELNPPIICRPNDVVTIGGGEGGVVIGGYTTYAGET